MSLDPSTLTIRDVARGLRTRQFSSIELTESVLSRIERLNTELNAFITVTADLARTQARRADEELAGGTDRGPLHGVPISLKDLLDLEGFPTTAASRVRDGHVAGSDAAVVANLRQAGAVFVGKTNLHEFAFGTTSEDSAFGPARNPHDLTRSPGGSSGGSAASVVAGMALATVGTDTGGSVRIPASACGLVGLKPAFDEISCAGVVALSPSLDHVGPLTRTVEDAYLLHAALAGRAGISDAAPLEAAPAPRLAALDGYFIERLQPAVRDSFTRAIDALGSRGAHIGTATVPRAAESPALYLPICLAEAAALHAATLERNPSAYTPPVRLRLEMGRYIAAEDFARARHGREILRQQVDAALEGYEALLLPTLPIVAPPIGASVVDMGGSDEPVRNAMLRLTQPFNLSRHPAITLPITPSSEGLPIGLQLVGRTSAALLAVAAAVQRLLAA